MKILLMVATLAAAGPRSDDRWSGECPLLVREAPPRIAELPKEFQNPQSLQELNGAILRHEALLRRQHGTKAELDALMGRRCSDTSPSFYRVMELSEAGFKNRVDEDASAYGPGVAKWKEAKESALTAAEVDSPYTPSFCQEPPAVQVELPDPATALAGHAAVVERLRKDSMEFNRAIARQHRDFAEQLALLDGRSCRELVGEFGRLMELERRAFVSRRHRDLAALIEDSLSWSRDAAP